MLKKPLTGLSLIFVFAAASFAQKAYAPAKDSAERKAIFAMPE